MALIIYLTDDSQTTPENLIETLEEIADVKVLAHAATQAVATRWLTLQDGSWLVAIVEPGRCSGGAARSRRTAFAGYSHMRNCYLRPRCLECLLSVCAISEMENALKRLS